MNSNQMKTELMSAVRSAVETYLKTTRGANAFGARTDVTEPKPNVLMISAKTEGGLRFFEIKIKETF